jgi:hypothetical protein
MLTLALVGTALLAPPHVAAADAANVERRQHDALTEGRVVASVCDETERRAHAVVGRMLSARASARSCAVMAGTSS